MKPLKNKFRHGAKLISGTEWLCGTSYPHANQLLNSGRFGRMFPDLGGYVFHPQFLRDLGDVNGPMSGKANNPLSTTIPSGFTFLGQFIDHDITLDTTSSLDRRNDPNMIHNFRTPALELDNVYGLGRTVSPFLYMRDSDKMLLGEYGEDLPRNSEKTALIGDFRNDENFFVGNIQLAMLKFHNAVVDKIASREHNSLEDAQQLVRWHYQWIIVHEYLPLIIGQHMVDDILSNGLQYYKPTAEGGHTQHSLNPFIPIEFSVAAFRFGHSQVNRDLKDAKGVARPLFADGSKVDPFGQGFAPLNADKNIKIDWKQLFAVDPANPHECAARIDTRLAPSLMALPTAVASDVTSLATRNLLRGNSFALPAGETIAEAMGTPPLTPSQLGKDITKLFKTYNMPDESGKTQTPLWFYILKEAEVLNKGEHLGPVGGRIVGEVLIGLLMYDPQAYVNANPNWMPEFGTTAGQFTMADLLKFAGVV